MIHWSSSELLKAKCQVGPPPAFNQPIKMRLVLPQVINLKGSKCSWLYLETYILNQVVYKVVNSLTFTKPSQVRAARCTSLWLVWSRVSSGRYSALSFSSIVNLWEWWPCRRNVHKGNIINPTGLIMSLFCFWFSVFRGNLVFFIVYRSRFKHKGLVKQAISHKSVALLFD